MLTISAKLGKKFRVGDDIEFHIKSIRNGMVRITIKCPEGTPVLPENYYNTSIMSESELKSYHEWVTNIPYKPIEA